MLDGTTGILLVYCITTYSVSSNYVLYTDSLRHTVTPCRVQATVCLPQLTFTQFGLIEKESEPLKGSQTVCKGCQREALLSSYSLDFCGFVHTVPLR